MNSTKNLCDRIVAYLERLDAWQTKKMIYSIAFKKGFTYDNVRDALLLLEEDVRIGVKYEKPHTYYRFYPMSEEEIASRTADQEWSAKLP